MKACYKVFEEGEVQLPRIGVDRRILFRDVSWPKQHPFTPTKLGLELVPHTDDIVLHWGDQVLTPLQRGTLQSETVFWGLKAALFGDDHELSRKDRDRIEKQIGDLPDSLRYSALDEDVTTGSRQLRCEDLYSMYLKQAWRYILLKMKYEYPQLPWTSKSINEDGPLLRDCDIDVECVIPLPADAKPHHINAVVKAAMQAGIPAPYTVLEPAAAYAYDIQDRTENHGPVSYTYCLIVVDMGGASVDLQSWQVVGTNPLKVNELVPGVADWCGGNFINAKFRAVVQQRCAQVIPEILRGLSRATGKTVSEDDFLGHAVTAFEKAKRPFELFQQEGLRMTITGLPMTRCSMIKYDTLCISAEDVSSCFDAALVRMQHQIGTMIDRLQQGGSLDALKEILLVGGSSASPYLREGIRQKFEERVYPGTDRTFPVRIIASDAYGASTSIVKGALLLLMDKAFIDEQIVRRSYGVLWDTEAGRGDFKKSHWLVVKDQHDGVRRKIDVTKFLLKKGDQIGERCERFGPKGCWRALFEHHKRFSGWKLEEEIVYSDVTAQDGIWVDDPRPDHKIHSDDKLLFWLTEDDCSAFETRLSIPDQRPYKYLEYQVKFTITGMEMKYEMIIPRSGKFSTASSQERDYIIKVGTLLVAGAFEDPNMVVE